MNYFDEFIEVIQSNGWFILIGCLVLYYIYKKLKINLTNSNTQSAHREGFYL
jgi:hypothetical protein